MRRQFILNRVKQQNAASPTNAAELLEPEQEIINKFMSGAAYTLEDIEKCIQSISRKYSLPFKCKVIDCDKTFSINDCTYDTTPFFILYEQKNDCWDLLCTYYYNNLRYFFYKNSIGDEDDPNYIDELKEKHDRVIIKSNNMKDQENIFPNAPIILRNMTIMLQKIYSDDIDNFLDNFEDFKFCTQKDLDDCKVGNLNFIVDNLKKNEEFLEILSKIIDNIPDINDQMNDYRKILNEEMAKDVDDIDCSRLEEAKKNILQSEEFKKYESNIDVCENKYEKEMHEKYPKESEQLQLLFRLLKTMTIDDNFVDAVGAISNILKMDNGKLLKFFKTDFNKNIEDENNVLQCQDISKIRLPKKKKLEKEDCICDYQTLLSKLILGGDKNTLNQEEQNTKKQRLLELCEKVESTKNDMNVFEINRWAKENRGSLSNDPDKLCEAITILNKAYSLATGRSGLRRTQILSLFIFLTKDPKEGQLLQIQTGEGKTVIVSLLAIIKVLQGLKVDVITSNPVLAQEGVKSTEKFYNIFGITVATNTTKESTGKERKCAALEFDEENNENERMLSYTADVLYGTISSFQFDYLKDSVEALNIRQSRKFDVVILDEVDSMLIDNGGHIAKLTVPFPGMKSFRYIYFKIWDELLKADKKCNFEIKKKIVDKLEKLCYIEGSNIDFDQLAKKEINDSMDEFLENVKIEVRNSLIDCNFDLVPPHLKEYADRKKNIWIENAIFAKYHCNEYEQYRVILDDKTRESVIVPVDYLNTGTSLKNTVWSNGLHQFLQLKHNLYLTYESLTSSFISNIGYIKKYKNENIFGMTGTLGSVAEQELLSNIYNVNFGKIPTYKAKSFEELPSKIKKDTVWSKALANDVLSFIKKKRAVLIICKTEFDLRNIKECLKNTKKKTVNFNLRAYVHEEDSHELENELKPGDIILSTNLAGRGTDFKTSPELEQNGGLHVCVGFLPYNLRVEAQAFGRTARQGNNGTGQLIIRHTEVTDINIRGDDEKNFDEIKKRRDQLEAKRLEHIRHNLLPELNFRDEIFYYFSQMHRQMKLRSRTRDKQILLKDLKEFWAFWLEKNNYTASTIENTNATDEFKKFKEAAKGIIENGEIIHNPFYYIDLGKYYLETNDLEKAKMCLEKSIENENECPLLYGAHMKMFHIAIESGKQLQSRIYKALLKLVFIPYHIDESYKERAKNHLKCAQEAINKELKFMETNFGFSEDCSKAEPSESMKNIGGTSQQSSSSSSSASYLVTHLYSRYAALVQFKANIDHLLKNVGEIKGGIAMSAVTPLIKNKDQGVIKDVEITELSMLGLDAFYAVKEVYDVPNVVIHGAQIQLGAGLAALATAIAIPITFPWMGPLALTTITEAIIDLVMEVIKQGNSELSLKEYIKGKIISYGISIIAFGLNKFKNFQKIVEQALSYSRTFSQFLRRSAYLKPLCEKLATILDHFVIAFETALRLSRFAKLGELEGVAAVQISKLAVNTNLISNGGVLSERKEEWRRFGINGLIRNEFHKNKQKGLKSIEDTIQKNDNMIGNLLGSNLLAKLRTLDLEAIEDIVQRYFNTETFKQTLKNLVDGILKIDNFVDLLVFIHDCFNNRNNDFNQLLNKFITFIKDNSSRGNASNKAEDILEHIYDRFIGEVEANILQANLQTGASQMFS